MPCVSARSEARTRHCTPRGGSVCRQPEPADTLLLVCYEWFTPTPVRETRSLSVAPPEPHHPSTENHRQYLGIVSHLAPSLARMRGCSTTLPRASPAGNDVHPAWFLPALPAAAPTSRLHGSAGSRPPVTGRRRPLLAAAALGKPTRPHAAPRHQHNCAAGGLDRCTLSLGRIAGVWCRRTDSTRPNRRC
jgi:hypothetical protein